MRKRLPDIGDEPEIKSRRPTIRILPPSSDDPLYQEILADYEEAILSGLSKDEAASFALISSSDHNRLLITQLESDPDWLVNLTTIGVANLKATSRVKLARRVRDGESSFILPVAQATNADLSPKQVSIGIRANLDVLPENEKTALLSKFSSISQLNQPTDVDADS